MSLFHSNISNTNAEILIDNFSEPFYLHSEFKKFWEISLIDRCTIIRYGKLLEGGVEDKNKTNDLMKEHVDEKEAKEYVKSMITNKRLKGYDFLKNSSSKKRKLDNSDSDYPTKKIKLDENQYNIQVAAPAIYNVSDNSNSSFDGEYLEKNVDEKTLFYQVELNQNYLKITNGRSKSHLILFQDATFQQYSSNAEAKTYANKLIGEKIAHGYVRRKEFFKPGFTNDNLDTFKKAISDQMQNNLLQLPTDSKSKNGYNDNYSATSKRESEYLSDNSMSFNYTNNHSHKSSPRNSNKNSRSNSPSIQIPNNHEENLTLGKPTTSPHEVLLAETWDESVNPKGYMMSEKLDGVRCLWTGTNMYSRNKNLFYPPSFFTKNWPKSTLDGELWMGRNTFQQCVGIVKKHVPEEEKWKKIKFLVFDAPGLQLPFQQRYEAMKKEIEKIGSPYLQLVENTFCSGRENMDAELEKVLANDGEGLMLRDPKSYYERKRSKTLLKVKKFLDTEGIVIGFERRPQGDIKNMRIRMKNGIEFNLGGGLTDKERRSPPKIGSTVTFKYQNLSDKGVPRFPIYIRPYEKL